MPTPNYGRYGTSILNGFSIKSETQRGHDLYGRSQSAEMYSSRFEVVWPIPLDGIIFRSYPLADARRLNFVEHSRNGAQVAYTLAHGGLDIPGLWQLEFRISDDRKRVELLPACGEAGLSEHVFVLELESGKLHCSPPLLIERLRDFADGVLEIIELNGLCSKEFIPHPLQLADLPPPPPDRAADFYINRGYYKVSHSLRRLQVTSLGLELLPDWRLADRPQAANADGDFILPAPNRKDAAWLRGTECQYSSCWIRHQEPRLGGYLLTASGCPLFDVTPSFAWDDKGRYLALTHLIVRGSPENNDPQHAHQWQIWLLDTWTHSLRIRPGSIGLMPRFEGFRHGAWEMKIYENIWDAPGDSGQRRRMILNELLQLPEERLIKRGKFWHREQEQQPVAHWQAFDEAKLKLYADSALR